MILASTSSRGVGNETTKEMVQSMQVAHQQITAGMENYIEQHPEHVERIFEATEEVFNVSISLLLLFSFFIILSFLPSL
jgi:hypothetical protein